jgi:hypothetical protein
MTTYRFIDKAVEAIMTHLQTYLPAQIAAVNAERGLLLTSPLAYVDANVPTDMRSPLVEIFDISGQCTDDHGDEWDIACGVALSFSGNADLVANERKMRAYATALIKTIRSDATLGGKVSAAFLADYSSEVMRGDSSTTRNVFQLTVRCIVKDT